MNYLVLMITDKNDTEPKNFLNRLFAQANGRLSIDFLKQKMLERFSYFPFRSISKDELEKNKLMQSLPRYQIQNDFILQ